MSLIPSRVDRLSNTKKFHLISKKSSLTDVWVRTCVKSIFSNRRIVKPFSICYSSTQQIQEHKNDLLLFFFKEKCHNRSIWQVNQIENKRIQSFWSTIILVLDSITSVLNFVNRIKANFMEKLGFPDIKSVPWTVFPRFSIWPPPTIKYKRVPVRVHISDNQALLWCSVLVF